jgi:hypothetical protein
MNMFVRCGLVLILAVALVQTLQCYDCSVKPTRYYLTLTAEAKREVDSGVCKDGELGELVDCAGACFKSSLGR